MPREARAYTPVLADTIVSYIRAGAYPQVAAEAAGLPRADFRRWLEQLAQTKDEGGRMKDESVGIHPSSFILHPSGEPIDLHTLLGQFLAVRHEVNLQTKAVRAQQEQNAEALRQLSTALDALWRTQTASAQAAGR